MGRTGSVDLAIASFFPFSCDRELAGPSKSEGGSDDRVISVILVERDGGGAGTSFASFNSTTFFLLPDVDDDDKVLADGPRGFRTLTGGSLPSVAVVVEDLLFSFLILGSLFLRGFFNAGVFLARADSSPSPLTLTLLTFAG